MLSQLSPAAKVIITVVFIVFLVTMVLVLLKQKGIIGSNSVAPTDNAGVMMKKDTDIVPVAGSTSPEAAEAKKQVEAYAKKSLEDQMNGVKPAPAAK